MNNTVAYIKIIILSLLIFVQSFFLTQALINYFETQSYLSLNFNLLSTISALILSLTYTVSLSSPGWKKWSKFLIVPLPFTLGAYLNLFILEPTNALVISGLAYLILCLFIQMSSRLEKALAKSIPQVYLRSSIKGLLLTVSLIAASIVLLDPKKSTQALDQGIEEATDKGVSHILRKNPLMPENPELDKFIGYTSLEQNVGDEITEQVKTAIEPYRSLINIVLAIIILITFQGFNALIFLVYSSTIGLIFMVAKKTGFIKKEIMMIEKENLKF